MDLVKIGKFIAMSRKQKNLTQEQFAEILRVNHRTISRWENGKNMPDISLYKEICDTLDISVEELINGEKTQNKDLKQSYEKAIISTMNSNKKKIVKLIKIIILIILISLIIFISIISYYKNKYPKIDIYNMNVLKSDDLKLNENLTINKGKYKIYFYEIDSLQLGDINNNYYDLKSALKYQQVNINNVKNYLENQYQNGNIEKINLSDGKSKLYKTKNFETIVCNTPDGNKDIYFGTSNISTNLKGNYCGNIIKEPCNYTRTYKIINIQEDDNYDYLNITLKQYQAEIALVRIKRNNQLKVGKNYEFTLVTYETFEDTIDNIFKYSEIISIKETKKEGMAQRMDKICVNGL